MQQCAKLAEFSLFGVRWLSRRVLHRGFDSPVSGGISGAPGANANVNATMRMPQSLFRTAWTAGVSREEKELEISSSR